MIAKETPTHIHVGKAGGTAIVERSKHLNAIYFIEKLSSKGLSTKKNETKKTINIIPTNIIESLYKLCSTFLGNNISLTRSPLRV